MQIAAQSGLSTERVNDILRGNSGGVGEKENNPPNPAKVDETDGTAEKGRIAARNSAFRQQKHTQHDVMH